MKHAEFLASDRFGERDLLAFAYGNLIEDPPSGFAARLLEHARGGRLER